MTLAELLNEHIEKGEVASIKDAEEALEEIHAIEQSLTDYPFDIIAYRKRISHENR